MTKPKIHHQGVVYRNPLPGHQAICAYHPNLVPLSDDEILCFYRIGHAMYSLDGRIAQSYSNDGGKTWQSRGLVWGREMETGEGYTYSAPYTASLRDGRLIMLSTRYPANEKEIIRFNPKTGGVRANEVVMLCSSDQGRSWSNPQPINFPDQLPGAYVTSPVIELDDGSWFLGVEQWKQWDDPTPLHLKGCGLFSDDDGKNWGKRVDYPHSGDTSRMYSHAQYRHLNNGAIGATTWAQSIGGQNNYGLCFVHSDPSGQNWSTPKPTGLPGQTSCIGDCGNGRLVVVYSHRDTGPQSRPGIVVAFSDDNAQSWNTEQQQLVWDAVGQEYFGCEHEPAYPSSHDNIAFGKPELAVLPCGDIIVTWWATQACVTHIRYASLTVESES